VLDDVSHVEPHIESDLIVSTPSGVKLATHFPDFLHEAVFDGHVDVFLRCFELQFTALDFPKDFPQALNDERRFVVGNDAAVRQHAAVSDAALNVVTVKPGIEMDRCGVFFHHPVGRLPEPALPQLLGHIPILVPVLNHA
jgi:hypothetical protein